MSTDALTVRPSPATPTTGRELIRDFLEGRKETTRQAYQRDLRAFAEHLGLDDHSAVAQLLAHGVGTANTTVLRYRNAMAEAGLSPATINRRLAALRSLVKMAKLTGGVSWEIGVQGVKAQTYKDTSGPGVPAIQQLLDAARSHRDRTKVARDVAILRLMADLALRRAEVAAMDVDDVELDNGRVRVLGKGKTDRETLDIPPTTRDALRQWLDRRVELQVDTDALFLTLDRVHAGRRISGRSLHRLIQTLSRRAGLPRLTWPHALRHTSITTASQACNGDLVRVRAHSRHADIQTVLRYVDNARADQGKVAAMVAGAWT